MFSCTREDPMRGTETDTLSWFEVPQPFIEPMLRILRLGNTALDTLFYDVNAVTSELLWRGSIVVAGASERVLRNEQGVEVST
jgi:hypothetical protein